MAVVALPPRKSRQAEEVTIKRNRSSLEVLMQTGFPRSRVEKALAATGDKGVHLASDWLLSHMIDPTLDEDIPRDYILYLCPVGQLQQHLIEFWKKSYETSGWNRAHNYFPHITLCSFFKASDNVVSKISHLTKTISERFASQLNHLGLEYFSSPNFIGLFVSSNATEFLKKIVTEFAEELKNLGVQMEPHRKQLHISLAYQFRTPDKDKLESQAQGIKLDLPVRWDLRLYSRDPRISNCQVRKVLFEHEPRFEDELRLIPDDFIYLSDDEIKKSVDSWCKGMSWLSGCNGMFPLTYSERVAETETWTMHRSIPIVGTDIGIRLDEDDAIDLNGPIEFDNPVYHEAGEKSSVVGPEHVLHFPASPKRSKKSASQTTGESSDQTPEIPPRANQKVIQSDSSSSPSTDCKHQTVQSLSTTQEDVVPNPVKSGPPLLVPRINKTNPVASSSNSGATANPAQSIVTQAGDHSSKQQRESNLIGSATMPANACTKQKSPKHLPMPSHNAMNVSASGALGVNNDNFRAKKTRGPRQLYVVRHGERIDFTFGKDWITNSFDSGGNYIRYDLNMPKSLPKRTNGPKDYARDSPLTTQGHFQATLIGNALKDVDVPISHVYASSSLRCIQTATDIMDGLGLQRPIHVEPGLFEWLGWYRSGMPVFMSNPELIEAGFNIATSYDPIWPTSRYNMDEKAEDYYDRCHEVTKQILQKHENEGGNALFVVHKGSIDTCTLQLRGKAKRPYKTFHRLVQHVPYCGVGVVEECGKIWKLVQPPIPAYTCEKGKTFDWSMFL